MAYATISGIRVEFPTSKVTARQLMDKFHPLMGWGNCHYRREKSLSLEYYYLPRQNKPNGITGDGAYKFDLEECSDFVMVPVECNSGEFTGLNLYGRGE